MRRSGGPSNALDQVWSDSPPLRGANARLREHVVALLPGLPEGRKLRILELGGGTGAATSHLLPFLPAGQIEYLFTDISDTRFAEVQQRFQEHPSIRYEILDSDRDPVAQGFAPHWADVIIAPRGLSGQAGLPGPLAHLRHLIASSGLLIVADPGPAPLWFDFLLGPLGTRAESRLPDEWLRELGAAGFIAPDFSGPLVLARGPRLPGAAAALPADRAGIPRHWLLFGDQGGVAHELASLLRQRGDTAIIIPFSSAFAQPGEMSRAWAEFVGHPGPYGVVHLWSLDGPVPANLMLLRSTRPRSPAR